ncbi:hypothetical protein B484DRAFT_461627, partial [Ochromonadaceae sp. CCMP2298]
MAKAKRPEKTYKPKPPYQRPQSAMKAVISTHPSQAHTSHMATVYTSDASTSSQTGQSVSYTANAGTGDEYDTGEGSDDDSVKCNYNAYQVRITTTGADIDTDTDSNNTFDTEHIYDEEDALYDTVAYETHREDREWEEECEDGTENYCDGQCRENNEHCHECATVQDTQHLEDTDDEIQGVYDTANPPSITLTEWLEESAVSNSTAHSPTSSSEETDDVSQTALLETLRTQIIEGDARVAAYQRQCRAEEQTARLRSLMGMQNSGMTQFQSHLSTGKDVHQTHMFQTRVLDVNTNTVQNALMSKSERAGYSKIIRESQDVGPKTPIYDSDGDTIPILESEHSDTLEEGKATGMGQHIDTDDLSTASPDPQESSLL